MQWRNRIALVVEDADRIAQAGQSHRLNRLRMAVVELHPRLPCPARSPADRARPYPHRHRRARAHSRSRRSKSPAGSTLPAACLLRESCRRLPPRRHKTRAASRSFRRERAARALEVLKGSIHLRRMRQFAVERLPPSTRVALHTIFFMPCAAGTQGPPVSLHPGELAMATSMPRLRAVVTASLNACFHSGVM